MTIAKLQFTKICVLLYSTVSSIIKRPTSLISLLCFLVWTGNLPEIYLLIKVHEKNCPRPPLFQKTSVDIFHCDKFVLRSSISYQLCPKFSSFQSLNVLTIFTGKKIGIKNIPIFTTDFKFGAFSASKIIIYKEDYTIGHLKRDG